MPRRNKSGGANDLYTNFANQGFRPNPAVNREAMMERMYLRLLTELCMNRFKWTGLPETVNVRYLEMTLMRTGLSVFFKDPSFGYLALTGTGAGTINYENEPTKFQPVGAGQTWRAMDAMTECVPIWSNYARVPDLDIIMIYASKFANLDRTVEINSKSLRAPKMLISNEDTRLTMRNINRQIDEGQNQIEVNTQGMGDLLANIFALDIGPDPLTIEKVQLANNREWNKCMTLLGIDNSNQDKKERLVSDEVDANNGQIESMRYVNLNARRIACDQINKLYGLNVSVDYWTDDLHDTDMRDEDNAEDVDSTEDEEAA